MKPMKPEDVPDAFMAAAEAVLVPGKPLSTSDLRRALAAVIQLVEARERGACAGVLEARIRELQHNIDDNIAEVRVVEMKPADNRPLIKTRDWLRDVLTTIRARSTP